MTYFPTIHLNGTHPKDLFEGAEKTYQALRSAWEQMAASAPNARDYYVQGPDAFRRAADEHTQRMKLLNGMINDYSKLLESICDAPGSQGKLG
jgi:hypothetical protein